MSTAVSTRSAPSQLVSNHYSHSVFQVQVRLLPCLLPCALPPPPSLNTLQRFSLFPVFYFPSPVRLKEDFHFSSFVKETVGVGDHRSIFILAYSFALLQLPCKTVHVGNTSQISCAVSS